MISDQRRKRITFSSSERLMQKSRRTTSTQTRTWPLDRVPTTRLRRMLSARRRQEGQTLQALLRTERISSLVETPTPDHKTTRPSQQSHLLCQRTGKQISAHLEPQNGSSLLSVRLSPNHHRCQVQELTLPHHLCRRSMPIRRSKAKQSR